MELQTSIRGSAASFLGRLDPRVRVAAAIIFAIVIAFCEHFTSLLIGLALALTFVAAAQIGTWQTCRRFISLNAFILFLLLFLPLSLPGRPLLRLGPLVWSVEGVLRTAAIALKANSIMLAFAALVATLEPIRLGAALQRLGCPAKLTHLLFFAVRYFDVIYREYGRLVTAIKLRGFRPGFNRHTFKTYGYLVGMLLLRSLDRSERIFEAMKCRGFRNRLYTLTTFTLTRRDGRFLLLFSGALLLLLAIEWS
ncbi:cobalt ECF transporter T component CbiQ [candidate division KSB3 bacterium]|nr:cobalt ECF transporter T component CbiQ [candidate division KSB3 bacterium]